MASFVKEGGSINHTPESALTAGDMVLLEGASAGHLFGFATYDIPAGELGALRVEGEVEHAAAAAEEFAPGERLFYDAADDELTIDDDGGTNKICGTATEAKAVNATTARFLINRILADPTES